MICPRCGAESPAEKRFCGDCGAPLAFGTVPVSGTPPDADAIRSPGGRSAEERRLITALFADISGFTALAQRVDAEELHEIVDPIVTRLSSIADRNGGFVEKYAGDALLAVFGAPMAHEDDAERALLTAIEMHDEIDRVRRDLPRSAGSLRLHIGIASGHGIARVIGSEARTDYGVLGDAVIVAQRLESQAPTGETYVGALTVGLARDRFVLEPVGPLPVKGKAEPVAAWRLMGRASGAWTRPSPGASDVVGRDIELRTLEALVAELGSGTGIVAIVKGEPGVGKTTLVDALRRRCAAGGAQSFSIRCFSYGATQPFRPWADLLRDVAGIGVDDTPDRAGTMLAGSAGAARPQ